MVTLAVVPARAESRGLPGKHLRRLGGQPLIVHTIRAGLDAHRVDRLLVSTNDPAVARAARRAGAEVPFMRPDELAGDETPTAPVVRHALDWVEARGQRVELLVTLQATSPLRGAAEIDAAVALLEESGADSVVSVAPLALPASVVGRIDGSRFRPMPAGQDPRRQASPPAMRLTGGVYVTRRRLLVDEGRLVDDCPAALIVDPATAIDVDTLDDLRAARRAWRRRRR